jgi:hypothetical protein
MDHQNRSDMITPQMAHCGPLGKLTVGAHKHMRHPLKHYRLTETVRVVRHQEVGQPTHTNIHRVDVPKPDMQLPNIGKHTRKWWHHPQAPAAEAWKDAARLPVSSSTMLWR